MMCSDEINIKSLKIKWKKQSKGVGMQELKRLDAMNRLQPAHRISEKKNTKKPNDLFHSQVERVTNEFVGFYVSVFSMWRNIVATCGRLRRTSSQRRRCRSPACLPSAHFAACKNIGQGKPHHNNNVFGRNPLGCRLFFFSHFFHFSLRSNI